MTLEIIQTVILLILLDRSLLLHNKYKIAFEYTKYTYYDQTTRYFAIWLYCKKAQGEHYGRNGGKRLFHYTKIKSLNKNEI